MAIFNCYVSSPEGILFFGTSPCWLQSVQVDVGLIRQQKLRPEEAQEFETQFRSMIFYGSDYFWSSTIYIYSVLCIYIYIFILLLLLYLKTHHSSRIGLFRLGLGRARGFGGPLLCFDARRSGRSRSKHSPTRYLQTNVGIG